MPKSVGFLSRVESPFTRKQAWLKDLRLVLSEPGLTLFNGLNKGMHKLAQEKTFLLILPTLFGIYSHFDPLEGLGAGFEMT